MIQRGGGRLRAGDAIYLARGIRAHRPRENFENWNFGVRFPTIWSSILQDLVTLWSRNATRNCICGEK